MTKQTYQGTTSNSPNNNEVRNLPIAAKQLASHSYVKKIDPIALLRLAALLFQSE